MTPDYGFTSVANLRYGRSPRLDAWLLHFMTENNLDHAIDPEKNASPEQIRFMVALPDEQSVYGPFSDRRLPLLLSSRMDAGLRREYHEKWVALVRLVRRFVGDRALRKRILLLCSHKYRMIQATPIIIPSRLMKRFITIFLSLCGEVDPYRGIKARYNAQAQEAVESPELDRMLNVCPDGALACRRLSDFRFDLDMVELTRLMILSTLSGLWTGPYYQAACETIRDKDLEDQRATRLLAETFTRGRNKGLKVLYIPDTSGGLMLDLRIIRTLIRQGHRVMLALKEGFHFDGPTFWDRFHDPVLHRQLDGAHFMEDNRASKNALLRALREHPLLIISDGTREELNFYRTSVTFARAWKEADLVLAKGEPQHRRLLRTAQEFTRDILCFHRDEDGAFSLRFKPKAESVVKFSEGELLGKAEELIAAMREARSQGQTVMFYSAIIGSIPGQTSMAIKVVDTFVRDLRAKLEHAYIINPAEHFEEGMDADDLMFMWETVQRSGMIQVWRFQTAQDIERSFELMGSRVPPVWAGKDSTFSTGCTKEMRIALDMQRKYPEMQIIGPTAERFFRRSEYGVGKFSDQVLG
ncbi:ARMT1-like domain-containing protein [Desulfocurvus vexinensis]|uniref:ARMT1-like domain-containing protein n=1 Tax=Desulfocurvus vexinensis TaxID=399548 RepID=UPI00048B717B|nr:ARMT1-like domain-containing protein [Desulfocurvus vexinensis]